MKKTFLVAGIACVTMMAAAQSNARQDSSAQASGAVSQRDVATGQPSGRRQHDPFTVPKSTDASSPGVMVRESPSKISLGRTSVAADTQANTANTMNGGDATGRTVVKSKSNITNNRVAAGDVNGDGAADLAVSPTPAPAQMKGDFSRGHQPDRKASSANNNSSREVQSGLATGKRQHN